MTVTVKRYRWRGAKGVLTLRRCGKCSTERPRESSFSARLSADAKTLIKNWIFLGISRALNLGVGIYPGYTLFLLNIGDKSLALSQKCSPNINNRYSNPPTLR